MFLGSIAEYLIDVPGVGALIIDHANPVAGDVLAPGDTVWVTPAPGVVAVL